MDYKFEIVLLLAIGLALASLLGSLAQRCRLPSILGYLIAGYLISPYSPGFVADPHIAEQLAEIGVILMLFGVGLHFKLEDLISVKNVAIPGALCQTLTATLLGIIFLFCIGWPVKYGLILGLAISVASTVVLVRVLSDNHLLDTLQGHIAIGWLIVEDILTVFILVLLPTLALFSGDTTHVSTTSLLTSILFSLTKFILLAFLLLKCGAKIVGSLLHSVARLKNQELFTLTVLALTFVIATVSALVFDTSIALGAFLAGMVIGKTEVRHQAFVTSLPLKDLFAVIFFLSIGMLFNPVAIYEHFQLFLIVLGIILIAKPLAAFVLVKGLGYPSIVGVTVAIALAQIGEFSFILAEEATRLGLFVRPGYDVLVACALVSISINPLLFRFVKHSPERHIKPLHPKKEKITHVFQDAVHAHSEVIVVGFGPIGEAVVHALEKEKATVLIVEHNIDTLIAMKEQKRQIIYGDAAVANILQVTEVAKARLLVITVPEIATAISIIHSARMLHPDIAILARITYVAQKETMQALGVDFVCVEEEAAHKLAQKAVAALRAKS